MQVRDQLALLQYLQGRFVEAEKNAVLSLAAVKGVGTNEGGELVEAMCSLRLGIITFGILTYFPLLPAHGMKLDYNTPLQCNVKLYPPPFLSATSPPCM